MGTIEISGISIFSFVLFLIGGIDTITYMTSGKKYGIIPDHLLILLSLLGILFVPYNPVIDGNFLKGLSGSLFGFLIMMFIRFIGAVILKKESLGWGDIKMVCSLGIWVGWEGILMTLVVSSITATLISLLLIRLKKLNSHSPIPYAPFLSIGALSALFFL